jgi:hypothetical protein
VSRLAGPRLPTPAELRRATARTRAVMRDPAATPADRLHAAELEAAIVHAFQRGRGSQVQADLEHWLGGHADDQRQPA